MARYPTEKVGAGYSEDVYFCFSCREERGDQSLSCAYRGTSQARLNIEAVAVRCVIAIVFLCIFRTTKAHALRERVSPR